MKTPDSPETSPENRNLVRKRVDKVAKSHAGFLSTSAVVELVIAERASLRETIAAEILEPLIDRYDEGLNNDQMETLVWVVRHFVRGPDGEITLDKPPPNARKAGLRVV